MTSRIRATSRVHLLKAGTILILFVLFSLVYSCRQKRSMGTVEGGISAEMDHTRFAGDRTCRSCHRAEWEEWAGSHHQNAMAEASEESVLGDFRDVIFQEGMDRYRFFRKGEKFLVEAPGPDGRQQVYEVKYTFGFDPLQLYLVDFGKGKYQVLHAAWDRERREWFSLYPEESFRPGDWLHWTGGAMNWNSMCADCHSTNLKSRYIAEADSFHTTWAAVNVSCEACHGPGRVHADRMRFPESERASPEQVRSDLHSLVDVSAMSEIRTCAPCHSLRESLTDSYLHEGDFLDHFNPLLPHPPSYHPDGQVLQESFEFGSFLQSRMSAHEVRCTDCHHPHTLQLKETLDGNRLCLTCHDPRYDRRQHHFHPIGTEASHCVNCHMPGTYFMEVDFRRDHSFRIPRPDLSEVLGTPNACNQCHTDRTSEWAASNLEQWYGKKEADPFLEAVTALTEGKRGASDLLRQFLEDRSRPEVKEDDLEDAFDHGRRAIHKWVLENDQWERIVQSYAAAISFSDAMVGRLLNALENSPYADNTIVVLWSDHGMHMGEKENFEKFTLWELSTRIPFIFRVPGKTVAGTRTDQPVSLLDIYPTLAELAGFEPPEHLDGKSLVPLMETPDLEMPPVVTTYHRTVNRNWHLGPVMEGETGHAVRSLHHRYIYYVDSGLEELYDHRSDPNEWENVAYRPENREIVLEHRRFLQELVPDITWPEGDPEGYEVSNGSVRKLDYLRMADTVNPQ